MTVAEVIAVIEKFAVPEIEQFIEGLCNCAWPLDAFIKLSEGVAEAIAAGNEAEEMKAAIKAADATVDAAEQEATKA